MRGHIVKRYSDSYSIILNLGNDPATGKRKQQWVTVKGTKKEAEKRLNELLHQMDTRTFVKPGKTTLADYLEQWLKDYAYQNVSPSTADGYASIIHNHIIPSLGKSILTQLKPEKIQKYYSDKLNNGRCDGEGGLNPMTVKHHHICLHTALQHAVKVGMLIRNPVDATTSPRPGHTEMQTMNEKDIHIFLEYAKSTQYYALFYTALFTGMRRSELLGLRWQDVDLLLLQISVNRSLHQLSDKKLVFRQPKTEKSRRSIALTPSSAGVLREYYEEQNRQRQALGYDPLEDDDSVFCHYDGKPLLPNTVRHVWEKLAKRTGLKGIRLHDARHTHASLMLKQGIHPKVVQERLGHSTITTTLDTYSHVAPGLQQAAANKFDEIVIGKETKLGNKTEGIIN